MHLGSSILAKVLHHPHVVVEVRVIASHLAQEHGEHFSRFVQPCSGCHVGVVKVGGPNGHPLSRTDQQAAPAALSDHRDSAPKSESATRKLATRSRLAVAQDGGAELTLEVGPLVVHQDDVPHGQGLQVLKHGDIEIVSGVPTPEKRRGEKNSKGSPKPLTGAEVSLALI